MNDVSLTFDIDWAPDWAIEMCWSLCKKYNVQSTFFVTHQCDILKDLEKDPFVELGLHPNLMGKINNEEGFKQSLEPLLHFLPDAQSMRTHSLVQSTPFLNFVANNSKITTDCSLFLPFSEVLPVTRLALDKSLIRVSYGFEDDIASVTPHFNWNDNPLFSNNLSVFDFHPIHVVLNMDTLERYKSLKEKFQRRHLMTLNKNEISDFVNNKSGTQTFLENLLMKISKKGNGFNSLTIQELGKKYAPELV